MMAFAPTESVKTLFIVVVGLAIIVPIASVIYRIPKPDERFTVFQGIEVGGTYHDARDGLKAANFYMQDYLTPNSDDSYDSHWLYKNDTESPMQTWIDLTCEGVGKDKLIKKTLCIRVTPGR
jgi:hypothetical protein